MVKLDCGVHVLPIKIETLDIPTYCLSVEEEINEKPWFCDKKA